MFIYSEQNPILPTKIDNKYSYLSFYWESLLVFVCLTSLILFNWKSSQFKIPSSFYFTLKTQLVSCIFSIVSLPAYLSILILMKSHFILFYFIVILLFITFFIVMAIKTSLFYIYIIAGSILINLFLILRFFPERRLMCLSFSSSLRILRRSILDVLNCFIPRLLLIATYSIIFSVSNTCLLSLLNKTSFEDVLEEVINFSEFFSDWGNYVLLFLLVVNFACYYFIAVIQYWVSYVFGASLCFEYLKGKSGPFEKDFLETEELCDHLSVAKENVGKRFKGTINKLCLFETLFFPFNLVHSKGMYKYFYLKIAENEKTARASLNFWDKFLLLFFDFFYEKGFFYTFQSMAFAIRHNNKLRKAGIKSLLYFFETGNSLVYMFNHVKIFLTVIGFSISGIFAFLTTFVSNLIDDNKVKFLEVNLGINAFFSLLPFLVIANGLVFGGASFLVMMETELGNLVYE